MTAVAPESARRLDHWRKLVMHVEERIRKSKADRADLRRAVGKRPEQIAARRAHAILSTWVDPTDIASERACYTVAALIAAQRPINDDRESDDVTAESVANELEENGSRRRSLGWSIAKAVNTKDLNPATAEARLHLLCRQSVDGVHRHLSRLVMQLSSDRVPIDWAGLIDDLARWARYRDQVTKRWLQDYYRTEKASGKAGDKDGNKTDE